MPSLLTIKRKKDMAKRMKENYHGKRSVRYLAKKNWMMQLIGREPVEEIYLMFNTIV